MSFSGSQAPNSNGSLARADFLLQQGRAREATERYKALLQQDPENAALLLRVGLGYLRQKDAVQAELHVSQALLRAPASPHALNTMGIVKLERAAYEEALTYFSRALDLDAFHGDALGNLATAYIALRQPRRARPYLERLAKRRPFSGHAHARLAANSLALNDVTEAIRMGRKAVRLSPNDAAARVSLADALEAAGQFEQAKYQYLAVLEIDPEHIGALAKLLALRGIEPPERCPAQAEAALRRDDLPGTDRVQLHLALARYHDRRKEYRPAFEHVSAGNAIKFKANFFDSDASSQAIDRIIATFDPGLLRRLGSRPGTGSKPIFIVGMPRSGTTLVEQILSSHPDVQPGGELPIIISTAMQIGQRGGRYPEAVGELTAQELAAMANAYQAELESRGLGSGRVTDKMPFNFMHLGLIVALFPDAKIIHCIRDPRDTCLSCLFTTFSESLQFASDTKALGRYYLDYARLMDHWRSVLPVSMFEVQYERLVSDTEETVRRLLAHCDLAWDDACLRFYRNDRGVRTPSRWQVRQPIYTHSIGRWRNYAEQLQPLISVLQPALRDPPET